MTSTAGGAAGPSYGWINRELIASGERRPHINVFGGEDRFWLGPEGGQFSIFFKQGDEFTLDKWQTPEAIDWGAWEVVSQSKTEGCFRKPIKLTNYSGTRIATDRGPLVRLLPRDEGGQAAGRRTGRGDLELVAYESENRITNTGSGAWTRNAACCRSGSWACTSRRTRPRSSSRSGAGPERSWGRR